MRVFIIICVAVIALLLGLIALSFLGGSSTQPVAPPQEPAVEPPPLALPPPVEPVPPAAPAPSQPTEPGRLETVPSIVELRGPAGIPSKGTVLIRNAGGGDLAGAPTMELTGTVEGVAVSHDCPEQLSAGAVCRATLSVDALPVTPASGALAIIHPGLPGLIRVDVKVEPVPPAAMPVLPTAPVSPATDPLEEQRRLAVAAWDDRRRRSAPKGEPTDPGEGLQRAHGGGLELASAAATFTKPRQDDFGQPAGISSWPVDGERLLLARTTIRAALTGGISSERPGPAEALVERNVFTSEAGAAGRRIAIPAGARLIGTYATVTKQGESRVDFKWTRVVFRAQGGGIVEYVFEVPLVAGDEQGRTGVPGEVDNRRLEKFGLPILTSLVDAGIDIAAAGAGRRQEEQTVLFQSSQRSLSTLGDVTKRLLDETVDIRPIITLSPGQRMAILIEADVRLRRVDERPVSAGNVARDAQGRAVERTGDAVQGADRGSPSTRNEPQQAPASPGGRERSSLSEPAATEGMRK